LIIPRDRSDDEFELVLRTIRRGHPVVDAMPVYAPGNYLVFRVYEAARKLRSCGRPRIAAVVIDDQTWHNFELPLRNRWINWRVPRFLGDEAGWVTFLAEQRARYPHIEAELQEVIRSLDAVWILRLRDGYQLSLEYQEQP
jgi:hypothetical protein